MFINEKQKHLLESDAKSNNIERVSVWLYNDTKDAITSEVIYSLSQNTFLPGLTLLKKDFPNYFKALEGDRIIDAHDAFNDSRTSEFTEVYLKPLNISSLLDVPIKIGNHTIGVVCHEHIGEKRNWTTEEVLYATSIADLFALAIETAEKDKIFTTLLDSERNFNLALNSLPVIFWTTDLDLNIISTKGKGLEIVGLSTDSEVGKSIYDFKESIKEYDETIDAHEKALNGLSVKYESHVKDQVFENYVEPLKDENGALVGCIGLAINISDRKKIEQKLKSNEERFRILAESTTIIPWEADAKTFQFTYVGPQAEAILGYPVEEWYTQDFWPNHIHAEDREKALDYCVKCFKSLSNYDFEYRMVAKNGDIFWFHDIVTVETKNNVPISLRGYLIDITTRKVAEEKIQKMNYELELRVEERTSELKAINRELEKAKVAAEQSKIAKELFLASMSHEIRTPLNAIIGFQQLLKETSLNEEQKEYVESIDFAGRNLLVIINDILDLSKIESGKFEFDEVEFNVSDVINSVIELISHRAKEKHLKVYFSHDSMIPNKLYGDSTRLSQVLLNLLGNAVKFTEKGEVHIRTNVVEETKEYVLCEFKVEDTGIGIPKEKLVSIFDSFSQENAATTRKYGGTGLGLTISKKLVEMQGGEISVESEKNKGSVFTVRLKLNKNSSRKDFQSVKEKSNGHSDLSDKVLDILLAEDVVLNQRLVVKIMERWGHNLDIAENGKVAVDMILQKDYDLVLMDIQMPVMDGYHAAETIRGLSNTKKQKIPIIALTAHASHAEAEKCINLGMNAYLAKPFNQQSLQAIIKQLTSDK